MRKSILTEKEESQTMLSALVSRNGGLMLNSIETARAIRATDSSRGLDEDRKKGNVPVPEYCDGGKAILYPAQKVVEFHMQQSRNTVKTTD
ncbi:MAG: hypothetical protein DRG78_20305 [Epsilonproteobacteria bacterium]|nr:MAG: hypothetical protein DRG78_20305 [Campylobacterota bacterium]